MIIYQNEFEDTNFQNNNENLIEYNSENTRIPPFGNYPNFPPLPNSPYEPGGMNKPGMQLGKPPKYTPNKNEAGVQSLKSSKSGSPNVKAVSPNSISFCLYKFTYIWEVSGRSYWVYLINVDRVSISGFRWIGFNWFYFGIDLKKIDSFICYRNNLDDVCDNSCYRSDKKDILENIKTEFSNDGIKNIYSRVLSVIDIPESKEDVFLEDIGVIDGKAIQSRIPCIKTRNVSYQLTLEVSYPENINEEIKEQIIFFARDASIDAYEIITSTRKNDTCIYPLEIETRSSDLIPKSLSYFSKKFSSQIRNLPNWKELSRRIHYSIRQEKINGPWKIQNPSNTNRY
ncbi:hypothetical protein [Clostridium chauvoei]|uniref:Uncharacterized protein n=2 Tax=Clostridium chauvoei TaxID=46867 RepID=S6EY33_9CLOT|nr:hypothetical protein [Clostridium chauvoei]ATD54563.1 hypothetical protein BTM20_04660 [Clostridium chauvoei]ATD57756.1 hypothetical protein BTM21_08400 [Clostridium chauvoei]MBX7281537.1 hypothetical protein [Clostridium chauvoei]MBX7284057.1 hypothetical protein [Clostridium chauvoei]MBX7286585.1 hypothetical protein [Clostridium chauvoei]